MDGALREPTTQRVVGGMEKEIGVTNSIIPGEDVTLLQYYSESRGLPPTSLTRRQRSVAVFESWTSSTGGEGQPASPLNRATSCEGATRTHQREQ